MKFSSALCHVQIHQLLSSNYASLRFRPVCSISQFSKSMKKLSCWSLGCLPAPGCDRAGRVCSYSFTDLAKDISLKVSSPINTQDQRQRFHKKLSRNKSDKELDSRKSQKETPNPHLFISWQNYISNPCVLTVVLWLLDPFIFLIFSKHWVFSTKNYVVWAWYLI